MGVVLYLDVHEADAMQNRRATMDTASNEPSSSQVCVHALVMFPCTLIPTVNAFLSRYLTPAVTYQCNVIFQASLTSDLHQKPILRRRNSAEIEM